MTNPDATAGGSGDAPRGLLAIFAHPDDETFAAGGVMALAATGGVPVWSICATNGDEGGLPDEQGDHAMDPEIRIRELRCACAALGIHPPIFLGYRDSGMEGWTPKEGAFVLADRDEVVGRLAGEIRRLRPAVVVTFDPGGGYGHPDHRRVSDVATAAFRVAHAEAAGPQALYHSAMPRSVAERMVAEWSKADTAPNGHAPTEDDLLQRSRFLELARPDEEITTRVDVRSVMDRKRAAFACHASQLRNDDWDDEAREGFEQAMGNEVFVRVVPEPAAGEQETALQGL
jgi:N-acetyl-1-D-myo-inositol-2-amino-2-deoxy-alpha-D-glucopyranoside deacetylase